MSDERGRGAGDDAHLGGERPDREDGAPAEPEFGSSEWLLQQLTGGRHVDRPAEPEPAQPEPAEPEPAEPEPAEPGGSGTESLPARPAVDQPPSSAADPFADLLGPGEQSPGADDEPASELPVAFSWNLKPGEGHDPLVGAPAAESAPSLPEPEPETGPEPAPTPPPGEGATTPADDDDVREQDAGLDPVPSSEPPVAAGSWVIETPAPPVPATPEPTRTIFDPPGPAAESDDSAESHGLAALLGFGAAEPDAPSGRSIIGDTTSVIPIVPADLGRPPASAPAAEPAAVPDASATETPTQQLDAAAMAALLRHDERDDVLPSEPAVPAAEAELALGGVPSPATSPIDAASIAAASEPEPFAPGTDAAETADDGDASTDDERTPTDGIAALFGPVATPVEDVAPGEFEQPAAEPDREGDVEPEPEPEPELGPEPAADLEGPQLTATLPFSRIPEDVEREPDERAHVPTPPAFIPVATQPMVPASAAPPAAAATATPATAPTEHGPAGPGPAGPGIWDSRNNRILLLALAGLAVVLVLVGLFALGTLIPSLAGAPAPAARPAGSAQPSAPSPTPTPTPTPVPTVTPKPAAAVGPGTHPWDALGGGECLQPFTSVWAEEFTVVDCSAPHAAQLLYTNVLSADPAAPYPGADALAQQIPGLCTASGVVDLGAAGAYPDLQVTGSFPATEEQWKGGQRSYYCFANRSSGQPLTSSVAGPGPSA